MTADFQAYLDFFLLDEQEAFKHCQEQSFSGTGPGGQHKNRVRTGIRLTHNVLKFTSECSQHREGKRNRREALRLLRLAIAYKHPFTFDELQVHWRKLPQSRINTQNPKYPIWLMCVVSLWKEGQFELKGLKSQSHWSSSAILRQCARDSSLWQWIQTHRQKLNLKPFKSPL